MFVVVRHTSKTGKVAPADNTPVEGNTAWHRCLGKVVQMSGGESLYSLGRRASRCEVETEAHFGPKLNTLEMVTEKDIVIPR